MNAPESLSQSASHDADADALQAFAESAKALLITESPLARIRQLREAVPRFERPVWQRMVQAGWTAILAPAEHGGLELDLRHACAIAQALGRHPAPEPFVACAVQAVALLSKLPSGTVRDSVLSAVVSGDTIAGVAWQERAGQIEPDDTPHTSGATRATPVAEGYSIAGEKKWVVPGTGADGWIVSAQAADGLALFWVPHDTPGVTLQEQVRADGSPSATLELTDVRVAATHCLASGDAAIAALSQANDMARIALAAELLGVAQHAFEATRAYLVTRVQFGKPIGANQGLQHRLVDAYIQIELAADCLNEVLRDTTSGHAQALAIGASRAKARCAHAALHVTREAVQMHGAIGFTDEYDLGLYVKRALGLASWLGGAPALRARHHALVSTDSGSATVPETVQEAPPAVSHADWSTMSEADFRAMVRGFFERHYPEHLRHLPRRLRLAECREWYMTLSRQGWLAPAWPRTHGGMELPPDKLLAFIEEMEAHGVGRVPDQGIINLGPVLIHYGTPEQQREYMPKILSGEHIWSQGYSEPNAGSDLASLRTEAIADGDDFIVNGQKIWTTLGHDATHIFALVRTDKTAKKQQGISFLLIDLTTPGVTVRPIRNIAGESEFCEVFFQDVRVPQRNLVGKLNEGWTIAKSLLGFERLFVGSPMTSQYAMGLLRTVARARGLFDDPAFVARFAQLELDVADHKSSYARFADIVKRGGELPPSVSILKIWATENYTAITRVLYEVCEEDGGTMGEIDLGEATVNVIAPLMTATITTIYGGSNEIQRNILAKAVLELPGG
jgi:alkylation response protein AidB-like acyl-CoA dehydrogenase